jgi:hypothetical protein
MGFVPFVSLGYNWRSAARRGLKTLPIVENSLGTIIDTFLI